LLPDREGGTRQGILAPQAASDSHTEPRCEEGGGVDVIRLRAAT
jgi:hypothetical protein